MIEFVAAAVLSFILLLSNGLWWRKANALHHVGLLLTERGQRDRNQYEAAEAAFLVALKNSSITATRAIIQAGEAEAKASTAQAAMMEMESRFAVLPEELPTPAIGRHKHRWDTMLADQLGWRCGICGDPKGHE